MSKTCKTCAHFSGYISHKPAGECRRNAPVIADNCTIYNDGKATTFSNGNGVFPRMNESDGCGQYEPRIKYPIYQKVRAVIDSVCKVWRATHVVLPNGQVRQITRFERARNVCTSFRWVQIALAALKRGAEIERSGK